MAARLRLTSAKRRQAIVEAVRSVFAEKGFDGTTTRELANAAGVSEALIYKHFPSKELLYAAMLDACAKGPAFAEFNRILALKGSTSTLVIMVHFAISYYAERHTTDPNKAAMNCLIVRSLLEDGEFVRLTHKKFASAWIAKFEACLKEALRAGELRETPIRHDLRVWFVQHLAFSLMLHLHPKVPAIDYKASKEALIEQATWFALLGVGVKEEAIKRHYNPAALSLLAG
ncbi:MAG TPA: helix-turn-helix domain-containing protein [Methylomirabilota bacterium]|nr:helix-turn-helix domain-containing protein [Methylomirabilota bacterium]